MEQHGRGVLGLRGGAGRPPLPAGVVAHRHPPGAEDLVQTALTKAYAAWSRVCRADDPVAYVHGVLMKTFLSDRRRRWSGEVPHGRTLPDPARPPRPDGRPGRPPGPGRCPGRPRAHGPSGRRAALLGRPERGRHRPGARAQRGRRQEPQSPGPAPAGRRPVRRPVRRSRDPPRPRPHPREPAINDAHETLVRDVLHRATDDLTAPATSLTAAAVVRGRSLRRRRRAAVAAVGTLCAVTLVAVPVATALGGSNPTTGPQLRAPTRRPPRARRPNARAHASPRRQRRLGPDAGRRNGHHVRGSGAGRRRTH